MKLIKRLKRQPSFVKQLSDYEKGWIEAAIDGEGSLYFGKTKSKRYKRGFTWNFCVEIANTRLSFLEKAIEVVGEGKIYEMGTSFRRCGFQARKVYRFSLEKRNSIEALLFQIRLSIKEKQRLLMLEALSLTKEHKCGFLPNYSRLEEIESEMRKLNMRGLQGA